MEGVFGGEGEGRDGEGELRVYLGDWEVLMGVDEGVDLSV